MINNYIKTARLRVDSVGPMVVYLALAFVALCLVAALLIVPPLLTQFAWNSFCFGVLGLRYMTFSSSIGLDLWVLLVVGVALLFTVLTKEVK